MTKSGWKWGSVAVFVLTLVAVGLGPVEAEAQIPDEFTNLQVLPEDISRAELIGIMRGFSFATGMRCQGCHTGGDGVSFEGVDFADDGDEDKRKARFMLRMVRQINDELATMPDRDDPPMEMTCKNCHRGQSKPLLLTQDLRIALADGPDAMEERYRTLREQFAMSGAFDFREWEMNTLGESLAAEGRLDDAWRVYELNAEFHPESPSIQLALGQVHQQREDRERAIAAYERVLELVPGHPGATRQLQALRGGDQGS